MSDASSTFDGMTADLWQPLSARETSQTASWREGVPEGLVKPLRGWVMHVLKAREDLAKRIQVRLDLTGDITPSDGSFSAKVAFLAYDTPEDRLFDIVDCTLRLQPRVLVEESKGWLGRMYASQVEEQYRRSELRQLLYDARSVYKVNRDGTGLERRVDPTAAALTEDAISAAEAAPDSGSAARQLNEASQAIRALHPEADKAYSLAIKAVESAAHAVIEPDNRKATLSSMLRILDKNPTAFEVEIAGLDRAKGPVAPATAMMRMLWQGQTSRHGSKEPTRTETLAEAEMAVQLASVLVLWFTTGKVRRQP